MKTPMDYVELTDEQRAVSTERQKVYGHPFENHMGISMAAAGLLQPYWKCVRDLVPLPAHVWGNILGGALKINRTRLVYHGDNYVDAQVYQNFAKGWQQWFSVNYPGGAEEWHERWTMSGALGMEVNSDHSMPTLQAAPVEPQQSDDEHAGADAGRGDGDAAGVLDSVDRGMADWVADVLVFHTEFGQRGGVQFTIPVGFTRDEHDWFRRELIDEEYAEFVDDFRNGNFPGAVKELIDLIYVSIGALISWGVDPTPIWKAVHESNMRKAKLEGEDKVQKPEGWQAPDIEALLRKQGWVTP